MPTRSRSTLALAALGSAALAATAPGAFAAQPKHGLAAPGAVFAETNDAHGNFIIDYQRLANGRLKLVGSFPTGGVGTSHIRLSSQGPVTLSKNHRWLFVANVASSDITVFAVQRRGLRFVDKVASGGQTPNSIAVRGDNLIYVLNNGDAGQGNVTAFRQAANGHLGLVPNSTRPLSTTNVNPAQVGFSPNGRTLVVTEKATNKIDTFALDASGLASPAVVHDASGVTPFGFDFTRAGTLVVSEAHNGDIGLATESSYSLTGPSGLTSISPAVADTQSEVCWTLITKDQRYAFITNFGSSTLSSYTVAADGSIKLLKAIAANTGQIGVKGVRDEALSADGRYLYAIDITTQKVHAWRVGSDGGLTAIGAFAGLPGTVAGTAAF